MADSDSIKGTREPFSPEMALFYFKEMSRKLDTICAVAGAAINAELAKADPDINTRLLFDAIADIAGEATATYKLGDMLESLIPETQGGAA